MDGTSTASSPSQSIFTTARPRAEPLEREPSRIVINRLIPSPRPTDAPMPGADAPLVYEPDPIAIARLAPAAKPAPITTSLDARILAILDAPLAIGETAMAGFARKEHELGGTFAQLSIIEARALGLRLSNARPGDLLAEIRPTTAEPHRLLNFLADAPSSSHAAARPGRSRARLAPSFRA
jgi:hypothetical protein